MKSFGATAEGWEFNGQDYIIELVLWNSQHAIPIKVESVITLSFVESIYGVFPSVVLTVDTTGNIFENAVEEQITELKERIFSKSFNFNADSAETIYISIAPYDSRRKRVPELGKISDNSLDSYAFEGLYYIYDETESIKGTGKAKQKTYYLRDVREQQLIETNIKWSTVDAIKTQSKIKYNISQLSNTFRKVETGKAIKHLLQTTFGHDVKLANDWDDGHTKVFYSSSAQHTIHDDLEYLLDQHISKDTLDNCIFKCERNGFFSLRSIENYFKKGFNKNGLGAFVCDLFTGSAGNYNPSNDPDITGDIPGHPLGSGFLAAFEGLENFSLLHVANVDSANELISSVVHSYNRQSKQFNIESENHHIIKAAGKMQRLYADNFPGRRGFVHATAILPNNPRKFANALVNHEFSQSRYFCGNISQWY